MGETIDLSSQELNQVPDLPHSPEIRKLILDYNDIEALRTDFCRIFTKLVCLSVNGNSLKTLPSDIGDHSKDLEELYANENSLCSIPDSLCNLFQLTKLHLTGNRINILPRQFSSLCNLTELTMDENELTHLPSDFGNLVHLVHLDLSNNFLNELPESFGMLKSLKELNLSNNHLKAIPDSFGNLPSLEIVDLTCNEIKTVPNKSLSAGSMIKFLMNENSLTALPDWISESKNMKELCVAANDLLEVPFPADFGVKNCNLELLDLSGNNITSLPESFGHLKQLRFLDLGSALDELERNRFIANGNNLKKLPDSFIHLENIIKLELDENELYELPTDFGCLSNLTYLDVSHNNLKYLPDSFGLLKNLKICLLSMNYITELPLNFGMLFSLEDLKLDQNLLTELPESFSNLTALTSLDLYNNKLKEVPEALTCLKNLRHLDLRENEFGLCFEEIPEIAFEPTYLVRSPEFSENWRGRKRPDISQTSWVETKAGARDESKLSDNVVYSALTSSSSLWRKHGQSDVRFALPSELQKDPDCITLSDQTANEEFWDKDIYEEVSQQNGDLTDVDFDLNLDSYNQDENDGTNSSEDEDTERFVELSDWESDDWTDDTPSCFKKIYRHPSKEVENDKLNVLIPSDMHVNRITVREVWQPFEDGQFEDA